MKNTFLRWLFRRPSAPPASADGPREDDDVLSQVRMNWTRASAPSAGFFTEEVSQINANVPQPAAAQGSAEPDDGDRLRRTIAPSGWTSPRR